MSGILYICATPIGNLEDITMRVLRILKEADIIAAEDTRHTLKLLNHFEITKPLFSYHEHNKEVKGPKIVEELKNGKNVALVTDAGMPCISDPGQHLVQLCHYHGIAVTCAPGATAAITALALSGLYSGRFIFEGFLPLSKKDRIEILQNHINEDRSAIFYEAPHHLKKTLTDMYEILGARKVALVREITKKYEQIQQGTLDEFVEYFEKEDPRGEYVIILEGIAKEILKQNLAQKWESIDIAEHFQMYLDKGMDKKEAMKAVASDRNVSKSTVYSELLRGDKG